MSIAVLVGARALVPPTAAQARVIQVRSSIQAAVDTAGPGDVVLVPPGIYHENVLVSTDRTSIVGLPGAVIDGTGVAGSIGVRVKPASPAGTAARFPVARAADRPPRPRRPAAP